MSIKLSTTMLDHCMILTAITAMLFIALLLAYHLIEINDNLNYNTEEKEEELETIRRRIQQINEGILKCKVEKKSCSWEVISGKQLQLFPEHRMQQSLNLLSKTQIFGDL